LARSLAGAKIASTSHNRLSPLPILLEALTQVCVEKHALGPLA